jgi:hypothetical protein
LRKTWTIFKSAMSRGLTNPRNKEDHPSQGVIWTIDLIPCWSFRDRELEMSKNIDLKNPEIAMCEILTESEPLDQYVI